MIVRAQTGSLLPPEASRQLDNAVIELRRQPDERSQLTHSEGDLHRIARAQELAQGVSRRVPALTH